MGLTDIKQIMTVQDLLDIRLEKYANRIPNSRNAEMIFCDTLEKELKTIFTEIGYNVKVITREFLLRYGRADFVITHGDSKYIIIEVKYTPEIKTSNDELKAMFSVGQVLTYKMALCEQYQIDPKNVEMCIITNDEYVTVLNNIIFNKLKISYLVYGENGVKYYGSK